MDGFEVTDDTEPVSRALWWQWMHQLVGVIDEREAALACLADCFCSSLSSGVVGKVESAKVRVC